MGSEFIYFVSFVGGVYDKMVGFYSSFEAAVEAIETFVYDNNAKLRGDFVQLADEENYECYSAIGRTVLGLPFTAYIQKMQIDTPIEET